MGVDGTYSRQGIDTAVILATSFPSNCTMELTPARELILLAIIIKDYVR